MRAKSMQKTGDMQDKPGKAKEQDDNCSLLKKKERLLDTIYKATTDGILVIGTDYLILDHNQAIAKMAGKKDIIGQPCHKISHGYDTPCWHHGVDCPLKNIMQTGKKSVITHAHKSGHTR
jgi:PAS domain-containing protein